MVWEVYYMVHRALSFGTVRARIKKRKEEGKRERDSEIEKEREITA
jgi:hypothetical protein